MKNIKAYFRCWFLALALAVFNHSAAAQGTAFTYQGRLTAGTNAANGYFDFEFMLFNAATGGAQTGSTLTDNDIGVTNGVFTVLVDFGLSEKVVEKLLDAQVGTIERLGSMTPEQLEEIQGIGPKMVEHIQDAVNAYYGQFDAAAEGGEAPAAEAEAVVEAEAEAVVEEAAAPEAAAEPPKKKKERKVPLQGGLGRSPLAEKFGLKW